MSSDVVSMYKLPRNDDGILQVASYLETLLAYPLYRFM